MKQIPARPTLVERYFDYPVSADLSAIPRYWLAAGGRGVRMTGDAKAAFCAMVEGAMERAIAPANIADSYSGQTQFKQSQWSQSQAPFSLVDLGAWSTPSGREGLLSAFQRCAPLGQANQLVKTVCDMFFKSQHSLNYGGKVVDLYLWLNEPFDPNMYAQGEWIPDTDLSDGTQWQEFEIPWNFSMAGTPCDASHARWGGQQLYAPWGSYLGPGQLVENPPMNWLSIELSKLEREHIYVGSTDPQTSMEELVQLSPPNPVALGPLADGKLGNWMRVSQISSEQATVRRSSSEMAVLQSMLANMRYTALSYDYAATFRCTQEKRTYDRVWYIDPDTLDLKCEDEPSPPDEYTSTQDVNIVRSGSFIDYLHGAAAYDFKLALPESLLSSYVRQTRPFYGILPMPNPQEYVVGLRADGEFEGPGKSSVFFYRYHTNSLEEVETFAPSPYPSQPLAEYVNEYIGV